MRLLLNSGLSGPHAPFALAVERGHFREAGLEVEFAGGEGAAAVVPLIGRGGFEAGYGDLNALAARLAHTPETAPVGVFAMFNACPFTIAVRADSTLQATGLAGSHLSGHAEDAALLAYPALAAATGVDPAQVHISASPLSLGAQVRDLLLTGQVDGVFGFVNTIIAAVAPLGISTDALRFLLFADHLPDLYANCLMVSRDMVQQAPDAVRGLVHALNRGLADTVADPQAGMDALLRLAPGIDRAVQHRRLMGTLVAEMAHPEGGRIGIGDVDDARLARGLALLAASGGWPRVPLPGEVFTRAFLPPLAQRVTTLARPATSA